jgi:hypothetical protein
MDNAVYSVGDGGKNDELRGVKLCRSDEVNGHRAVVEHKDCEEVKRLREESEPAVLATTGDTSATGVNPKCLCICIRDYHNNPNASSIMNAKDAQER